MIEPRLRELAVVVGSGLRRRGDTIAVAEGSCGGIVSAALLSVPGASAYYLGGAVIYTFTATRAFMSGAIPTPAGMRGATEVFARYLAESVAASWGRCGGSVRAERRAPRPTPTGTRPGTRGLRWPAPPPRLATS